MKVILLSLMVMFMQPDVDSLINDIIVREGGYVNHPADKGGPTKYGITLNTLSAYRGKPVTAIDVQKLTQEEAFTIYKTVFYTNMQVDSMPGFIQDLVLDMNVLHGPYNSTKILQKSVNRFGSGLKVDGVLGPKTIDATKKVNPIALRYIISKEREDFVEEIVENKPSQKIFLNGWIKRIAWFINNQPKEV